MKQTKRLFGSALCKSLCRLSLKKTTKGNIVTGHRHFSEYSIYFKDLEEKDCMNLCLIKSLCFYKAQ